MSYGAFELTVGVLPNVPDAERVLGAMAAAGYEGTELGPVGYFGEGDALRERLGRLELVGAFVEIRFGEDELGELHRTLDVLEGYDAKAVLCDKGPRDGDVDLDGVRRAAEAVRERGFEPTFHHHMGTRVQTPAEVERLLEGTDIPLLLDSGHLTAGGGDPVAGMRDWRERINHLHVKDVSLDVLRAHADWNDAWRAGAFCELGTGDADLAGFVRELDGYAGWLVVEQDWVPRPDDDPAGQIEAQARNLAWVRGHVDL